MNRPLDLALLCLVACGAEAVPPTPVAVPDQAPPAQAVPNGAMPGASRAASPATRVSLLPTDFNGTSAEAQAEFAVGSNALSFGLFAHRPGGNIVLGSGSISLALAMTWAGARGTTAAELAACTGFGPNTHAAVAGLLREYNAPGSPLSLANRLYAEETHPFEAPFGELMRARYAAPVEPVDFRRGSNAARLRINQWVTDQTNGRITDLLPNASVDYLTRLILVNAAYFLGVWETPFDGALTTERPFSMAAGNDANVPMMLINEELAHADGDGVQIVELPYAGGRFSMVIVVPKTRFGLADIEARLSPTQWARWMASLASGPASLLLPRFEMSLDPSLSLVETLRQLGVESAFDEASADFTGMAPRLPSGAGLYVSDVLHRAFIRVDEAGTEAAAATAVVMATESGAPPPPPFTVRADQPFLFFVRDVRSGLILFIGRVAAP